MALSGARVGLQAVGEHLWCCKQRWNRHEQETVLACGTHVLSLSCWGRDPHLPIRSQEHGAEGRVLRPQSLWGSALKGSC